MRVGFKDRGGHRLVARFPGRHGFGLGGGSRAFRLWAARDDKLASKHRTTSHRGDGGGRDRLTHPVVYRQHRKTSGAHREESEPRKRRGGDPQSNGQLEKGEIFFSGIPERRAPGQGGGGRGPRGYGMVFSPANRRGKRWFSITNAPIDQKIRIPGNTRS